MTDPHNHEMNGLPGEPGGGGSAAERETGCTAVRQALTGGLLAFALLFLGHLFTAPGGAFQQELAAQLDWGVRPGHRLVGALPREHGKTTLGTVALVLREAARASKRNVLLVGANQQEASAKLRLIVGELEGNSALRAAVPGLLDPALDAKNHRVAYGDREVVLSSGVRIAAAGLGAKVRGQLHDGRRLDLVVLDDPEDDYSTASPTRRRAARAWVERALLNALDAGAGSLIWLGTLLHHDAVLARWLENKGGLPNWRVLNLAAIRGDGAPLWPEKWSLEQLERRELEIGKAAFAQEFLNRPVSADQQVFKGEDFRYYEPGAVMRTPAGCFIGGAELAVAAGVDPAIGSGGHHDFFAAVVVGISGNGEIYVLDVSRGRFRFATQLELLGELCRRWRPRLLGIESTAYQASLAHAVFDRGLPVKEISGTRSKLARIDATAVHAARGRLYLPAESRWGADFLREALEYPAGEHDDQLDALAYAVETALPFAGGAGLVHAAVRDGGATRDYS